MNLGSKIFVAGHKGLVGSAIVRKLNERGYQSIIVKNKDDLNLLSQSEVNAFFQKERPEIVFLAAAKVGGIWANNTYPAQFIYDNLEIQNNVINAAYLGGCQKFIFLGSSCIYPKHASQPIKEEALLTGPLEPTNEPYAIAKIAGILMCQSYRREFGFNSICLMPTNLYGPGDNFNLQNSHVLPALLRKFYEAKKNREKAVTIWGSGSPRREFLYVDDLADASVYLMEKYNGEKIVNVGSGQDIMISELAKLIQNIVGYDGDLVFDKTRPDGTPRKLLDVSFLSDLGWKARVSLEEGIKNTYQWLIENPTKADRSK